MSERAHPDDPNFHDRWDFRLRRGIIPSFRKHPNPYRAAFMWRYRWASQYCRGKDVLDVPCGMGWGTSLISGPRSLTGVDLNADAITEANGRYGRKAKFVVGDMGRLEFADASFDVICCLEGIEHVPVEVGHSFLRESSRVLRPEGTLLLSSPYCHTKPHSGNPFHIHEYQPDEIKGAVGKSFFVEDVITRDVDNLTVLYLRCRRKAS
jgi:2-polyprenyl-3-methyl-5-hydroxy-6-metoxy-1,4-benzoquinol methylase